MSRWLYLLRRVPVELLVLLVQLYQVTLSPILGGHCRFEPSCSHYFIGAVRKHGAVRGTLRGCWRILRCHPFSAGGYDPP
ncbi:MAG: membrane protein insertion efficiency factor YidD [Pirellulales bacterium]|nr:membrane protein insertion efficiency factor YidD [Pirellulales bacterium]